MVGERGFEPPTPLVPNQILAPIEISLNLAVFNCFVLNQLRVGCWSRLNSSGSECFHSLKIVYSRVSFWGSLHSYLLRNGDSFVCQSES